MPRACIVDFLWAASALTRHFTGISVIFELHEYRHMNRIVIASTLLLLSFSVSAQKEYFVYLQTDDGQPFYLRMGDHTYSSTSSGYLILPKMRDSSYVFRLGWPSRPDQQPYFTLPVSGKDRGLLVKNFGAEGWGLFDLHTLAILKSHAAPQVSGSVRLEPKQVSNFTDVLSKAANDPSLRMKEVKQEVKPDVAVVPIEKAEAREKQQEPGAADTLTRQTKEELAVNSMAVPVIDSAASTTNPKVPEVRELPVANKLTILDSVAQSNSEAVKSAPEIKTDVQEAPKETQQVPEKNYAASTVVRKSESSTTEGFSVLYIDQLADGSRDSIRIMIPNTVAPVAAVARPAADESRKFLDIPVSAADSINTSNECIRRASDPDFLKLRRNMAAVSTDDGMIREARKAFAQKCYTVKQVKNLGALFLNDAARFQFFEAAHRHVSDLENFSSLGEELKNEYYLRRFKSIGQ